MTKICKFETPDRTRPFSFLLASSHHHPLMKFYHISLLLLVVVLSAYSEGPQHAKSPEPTVCSNSSISLGVLAPILPQYEVFKFTLPSKVYMSTLPLNYESLNDNLKLVLITQAFKQNYHPKICVVYRGTLISLP
jgi:hypothetical protein